MSNSTATLGHNSVDANAAQKLKSMVERIERLEEEKKGLTGDISDIYKEASSHGFDVKVLRELIRERKKDPAELETRETLLEVYRRALGPLLDTPLGEASLARAGHA